MGWVVFSVQFKMWSKSSYSIGKFEYLKFNQSLWTTNYLHWGFPGKNHRIILKIPMNEIKFIRIITGVQERSILTRTLTYESIVYMKTIEHGFIPLTHIEDNLTPLEIANRAGELALF